MSCHFLVEVNHIDSISINFKEDSLFLLNICLAIIMFGISLGIKTADFKNLARHPRAAIVGIVSQFVILPAITYLLVLIINPYPGIALGMMLVAACPGGNVSNFISHLAKGNTALSVSLTAFSSVAAIFMTPFNLQLWAGIYAPTAGMLQAINVDIYNVFQTISLIIGIPLILGMFINARKPKQAAIIAGWLKPISIIIFLAFIIVAFSNNVGIFVEYIHLVVLIVFLHNAFAMISGYLLGDMFRLSRRDKRTLSIETGIQNSGLGLLLIFTFFDGNGEMALVAAWWGIWHIVAGLLIATIWSQRPSVNVMSS